MSWRDRSREAPRRYGRDDDVPVQGLAGIGIVALVSLAFAAIAGLLAVITALAY